jgi:predicted ATPase/DNA-binding SARP family transcriptional activator
VETRCRIQLFGELGVVQGDRTISHFRTQKAASLLGYLALHLGQRLLRERLMDLFWPDMDVDSGRVNLSTTLSTLRRELEPPGVPAGSVLLADRQTVQLNSAAVSTDVAEFERLLRAAARAAEARERASLLERAVELYRGELLPGCYEEWALQEQMRFGERCADALEQLAAAREAIGDLGGALEATQRAVQADPLREAPYRRQMRLYAALERPAAARETYRELERFFRKELGVSPAAATRELAEQIRRDPGAFVVGRAVPAGKETEESAGAGPAMARPEPAGTLPSLRSGGYPAPAPTAPPPPAAAAPALPLQLTRFFGRESELARLEELLAPGARRASDSRESCVGTQDAQTHDARLITLTGPGGAGKTRLAIEVARRVAPAFVGRAWFVDLTGLADASLIPSVVASALKLSPASGSDPMQRVVEALGGDPCLLLLDNFEHLIRDPSLGAGSDPSTVAGGGTAFVRLLLERVPGLTCLVTSRQPLHLGGEQEFPVPPLAVPARADVPARLLECGSVALYTDRARAAKPEFALTASNAEAVAALCRKLEGMPLAIEMAAAWAKTLPPARMVERLEHQLDLLVSRRRDLHPRQQSLRATIQWSYDLLSRKLQACFARLSVFRGGWTLEAAEAVCSAEPDVLSLLAELQDQSLILEEEGEEEPRYRMLEPLREFAAEKLAEQGETGAVREGHAAYFLALVEETRPARAPEYGRWLDRLQREYENLRAARECFHEDEGGAERELWLAEMLENLWMLRGHLRDGRAWLDQLLSRVTQPDEARARALDLAGRLASRDSDFAIAQRRWEERLAIMRALGNKAGIGVALMHLGEVAYHGREDPDTVRALWEESLAIMREVGDKQDIASCLVNLGALADDHGDTAQARRLWEECRALDQEMGVTGGHVLWLLGVLARKEGNHAEARRLWRQHLIERQEFDPVRCVYVLGEIASFAVADGKLERGARLWGAAIALREALDPSLPSIVREKYERDVSLLRATLGDEAVAAAFAEGSVLTMDEAVEYALEDPAAGAGEGMR